MGVLGFGFRVTEVTGIWGTQNPKPLTWEFRVLGLGCRASGLSGLRSFAATFGGWWGSGSRSPYLENAIRTLDRF